jgi:hypothetical protein
MRGPPQNDGRGSGGRAGGLLGRALAAGDVVAILNAAMMLASPRQRLDLADTVKEWSDGVRERALGELGRRDDRDPTEVYFCGGLHVGLTSEVADGEFVDDQPPRSRRGR